VTRLIGSLFAVVARFFRWWLGELVGFVPTRLRRLFRQGQQSLLVDIQGSEVVLQSSSGDKRRELGTVRPAGADEAALRSAIRRVVRKVNLGKTDVIVRLPDHQALRKQLVLPVLNEADLEQALFLQIDRQTPFAPEEVYFDYRVRERDTRSDRLVVEMSVAPRPVVDHAVEMIRGWGLQPVAVDVIDNEAQRSPQFNLIADRHGGGSVRAWSPVNAVLGAAALALLVAAVYIPLDQRRLAAEALHAQVAAAKSEAEEALQLRQQLEEYYSDSRFLDRQKGLLPTTITVMDELTRLFPDDTWLFELQVRGREIQVSGYSSAASALIASIDGSPLFKTPSFRSPVTQDQRLGLERFSLSFEFEERPQK